MAATLEGVVFFGCCEAWCARRALRTTGPGGDGEQFPQERCLATAVFDGFGKNGRGLGFRV